MIDPDDFRRVMGHFATGVTVVTTRRGDGTPCGLTVSAVSSVSLDPVLVLVCVDRDSSSRRCIAEAGFFAVNVLAEEGETLARRFAGTRDDRFDGLGVREEETGAPVLDDALAWLDCRVREELPGGDHALFLGEVVAADAVAGTPLVYFRGGYGRFVP